MSLARPLAVLGVTMAGTAGVVYYVHRSQDVDRARMHRAVEREIEEERRRRECAENGGPCDVAPPPGGFGKGAANAKTPAR